MHVIDCTLLVANRKCSLHCQVDLKVFSFSLERCKHVKDCSVVASRMFLIDEIIACP